MRQLMHLVQVPFNCWVFEACVSHLYNEINYVRRIQA
jgi:hypothetical protein